MLLSTLRFRPKPPKVSKAAHAYVRVVRTRAPAAATWFDVARAYDAGMKHGVEARESAKRHFAALTADEATGAT
jgi:hypothetical protein